MNNGNTWEQIVHLLILLNADKELIEKIKNNKEIQNEIAMNKNIDIEYESMKETIDEGQELIAEYKEENEKLKEINSILKYCVDESYGLKGYYQAGFLTVEEYELLKEFYGNGKNN